jgi:small multidrug resistance family-3 protein
MAVIKSLCLFILAGLCEIGGGYLVWLWLRSGKPVWYGIIGAAALILYGVVATWQTASFGKVYAAYGAVFIGMSVLWAWKADHLNPTNTILLVP